MGVNLQLPPRSTAAMKNMQGNIQTVSHSNIEHFYRGATIKDKNNYNRCCVKVRERQRYNPYNYKAIKARIIMTDVD